MTEAPDRLSLALADRHRLERELGVGGMGGTAERRNGGLANRGSHG